MTAEQDKILERLKDHESIHVARPDGQKAALALADLGQVRCSWGEGKDRGVLIVSRRLAPKLKTAWPGGGDVA